MRRGLEGRRSFGDFSPDLLPFIFMLLLIILTIYNLFFSTFNIFKVLKMERSIQSIDRRLEENKSKNDKLESMLELVKKDPNAYKEKFIREYLQLQKSDERIILFSDDGI
ncbi:septum formation initiator family protein [Hydrogenobacter thermophilus]|uniref:septum formation initiator family protein n=1 Tax=Hydrogenobacter thermophilus TaxID=940 RepID=UPI0030FCCB0F